MSRRQFLATSSGMATAFLAMNKVFGPVFDVSDAEAGDMEMSKYRAGQLSGDLARYHAEIDANLTAEEKEKRSRMAALYGRSRRFKDAVANDLTWRVATYEHDKDGWHMDTHPQKRRKRRTKFWQVWRPR